VTGNSSSDDGQGPAKPDTSAAGDPPAPDDPPPNYVERATALRGLPISTPRRKKSAVRKQTGQDLRGRDPEVPCLKAGNAVRDLVCPLMERQDRMNEEIFLKINDHGYRPDDLETELDDLRKRGR
jgi:hypothetical protein